MRDTFLAEAQSTLLALLFGNEAQANNYLDNLKARGGTRLTGTRHTARLPSFSAGSRAASRLAAGYRGDHGR